MKIVIYLYLNFITKMWYSKSLTYESGKQSTNAVCTYTLCVPSYDNGYFVLPMSEHNEINDKGKKQRRKIPMSKVV